MINFLKSLFHTHDVIYTSRTLVGRSRKVSNCACGVEVDNTNIYLVEGYCVKCDKPFKGKQEIIAVFDRQQPYDKEPK